MSNENKLSPEIMEEIQKKFPADNDGIRKSLLANGLPEDFIDSDRIEKEVKDNYFKRNVAIFGATIALTKQWVKVTDRLPEKDGDYMVSTSYKDVFQNIFKDGKWAIHMRDGSKITYWMPLPSPPQD